MFCYLADILTHHKTTTAAKTKPTPVIAPVNVQDEEECIVNSADDNKVTLTEEDISTLLQDTSKDDKGDDEWLCCHLEVVQVESHH